GRARCQRWLSRPRPKAEIEAILELVAIRSGGVPVDGIEAVWKCFREWHTQGSSPAHYLGLAVINLLAARSDHRDEAVFECDRAREIETHLRGGDRKEGAVAGDRRNEVH